MAIFIFYVKNYFFFVGDRDGCLRNLSENSTVTASVAGPIKSEFDCTVSFSRAKRFFLHFV